jgi:integrase
LAQARADAAAALREIASGVDPSAARKAAQATAELAAGNTLRAIAEAHLKYEECKPPDKRLRTIDQRRATFERLIYPVLGGQPIAEIRRGEILRLLDDVEAKRGGRMADVVLSVLRVVFDWHALRDESFRSPIVKGMEKTSPKARRRDRVLSDDELRAVWHADAGPFGAFLRFLLLTATRRNEAARMTWDEVKGDVWTIPAARFKSGRDHSIPLSRAALKLLAAQPRIGDCNYTFTSDGKRAIAGFTHRKAKLDAASGVTGWRLHDLRRVSRSLLSRAGVNVDIAELCLGHTLGGLRGTYDRHTYEVEKRRAFEALAAQIEHICDRPAKVTPIKRARASANSGSV